MDKNKRIARRFQDKTVTVIFNFGNKTVEGQSINISQEGICILLPVNLEINFVINCKLDFVFEGKKVQEEVVSKIVWGTDLGNNEFLAGITYLDTSKLDKYNLYLDFLSKKEVEENDNEQ